MGYHSEILQAVEAVNQRQKHKLMSYIKRHFTDNIGGKTFALWGLSFKPKTDDMREASSRANGKPMACRANVQAFDPESMEECQRIYGSRRPHFMWHQRSCIKKADALVICTEWQNFKAPDFNVIQQEIPTPSFLMAETSITLLSGKGIDYYAIGRGKSKRRGKLSKYWENQGRNHHTAVADPHSLYTACRIKIITTTGGSLSTNYSKRQT